MKIQWTYRITPLRRYDLLADIAGVEIIDGGVGKTGHVKETPTTPRQLTHLAQPGGRRDQVRPGHDGPDSVGSGRAGKIRSGGRTTCHL